MLVVLCVSPVALLWLTVARPREPKSPLHGSGALEPLPKGSGYECFVVSGCCDEEEPGDSCVDPGKASA